MPPSLSDLRKRKIVLLAHDIRSLWNVGSLFRSADCFAVMTVILSGYTGIPPRREITKTALGSDEWISWKHTKDPVGIIRKLRKQKYQIISLECTPRAVSLNSIDFGEKVLLILGNEVNGVPKQLLKESDDTMCIPMHGKKGSLNVAVAAGIALQKIRNG